MCDACYGFHLIWAFFRIKIVHYFQTILFLYIVSTAIRLFCWHTHSETHIKGHTMLPSFRFFAYWSLLSVFNNSVSSDASQTQAALEGGVTHYGFSYVSVCLCVCDCSHFACMTSAIYQVFLFKKGSIYLSICLSACLYYIQHELETHSFLFVFFLSFSGGDEGQSCSRSDHSRSERSGASRLVHVSLIRYFRLRV